MRSHLGVTLFLQTDLGSDPFNVFVQGLFRFLPWPGFMTQAGYTCWCPWSYGGTAGGGPQIRAHRHVVCMALGGPIIDVFTVLLAP